MFVGPVPGHCGKSGSGLLVAKKFWERCDQDMCAVKEMFAVPVPGHCGKPGSRDHSLAPHREANGRAPRTSCLFFENQCTEALSQSTLAQASS